MTERTPQQALADAQHRAAQARALADSPAFNEVVATIRRTLVERWLATADTDTEGREAAFFAVKALDAVKAEIQAALRAPEIVQSNHRSALNKRIT